MVFYATIETITKTPSRKELQNKKFAFHYTQGLLQQRQHIAHTARDKCLLQGRRCPDKQHLLALYVLYKAFNRVWDRAGFLSFLETGMGRMHLASWIILNDSGDLTGWDKGGTLEIPRIQLSLHQICLQQLFRFIAVLSTVLPRIGY